MTKLGKLWGREVKVAYAILKCLAPNSCCVKPAIKPALWPNE